MAFGVNNVTNLDQPVDRVGGGNRSNALDRNESRRTERENRQEVENPETGIRRFRKRNHPAPLQDAGWIFLPDKLFLDRILSLSSPCVSVFFRKFSDQPDVLSYHPCFLNGG